MKLQLNLLQLKPHTTEEAFLNCGLWTRCPPQMSRNKIQEEDCEVQRRFQFSLILGACQPLHYKPTALLHTHTQLTWNSLLHRKTVPAQYT